MKTTVPTSGKIEVHAASIPADPLKPATLSLKAAERALKRQLTDVRVEAQRLEEAKVVSQEVLKFKFSI